MRFVKVLVNVDVFFLLDNIFDMIINIFWWSDYGFYIIIMWF